MLLSSGAEIVADIRAENVVSMLLIKEYTSPTLTASPSSAAGLRIAPSAVYGL